MTIRLYVDEDAMDQDLVRALRIRALDVMAALDSDMIERTDEEHLEYATMHGRVLYSFNIGDFYQLHTRYLSEAKLLRVLFWHRSNVIPWVAKCGGY